MIHGMGIRFWFQLIENHNIRDIQQCQLIIRSLEDFVNVFSNNTENKEVKSRNADNYFQDQSDIEDVAEVMVIVLVLGIRFWQNTVVQQNVNDLKQCKVIIQYLEKFICNMKVEDNEDIHQDSISLGEVESVDKYENCEDEYIGNEDEKIYSKDISGDYSDQEVFHALDAGGESEENLDESLSCVMMQNTVIV